MPTRKTAGLPAATAWLTHISVLPPLPSQPPDRPQAPPEVMNCDLILDPLHAIFCERVGTSVIV